MYVVHKLDTEDSFTSGQQKWGHVHALRGEFLFKALAEDPRSRLGEIDCDPFYDGSKGT